MIKSFHWVKLNGVWAVAMFTPHDGKYYIPGKVWTYTREELEHVDDKPIENEKIKT